jgi:hypothetical protein
VKPPPIATLKAISRSLVSRNTSRTRHGATRRTSRITGKRSKLKHKDFDERLRRQVRYGIVVWADDLSDATWID